MKIPFRKAELRYGRESSPDALPPLDPQQCSSAEPEQVVDSSAVQSTRRGTRRYAASPAFRPLAGGNTTGLKSSHTTSSSTSNSSAPRTALPGKLKQSQLSPFQMPSGPSPAKPGMPAGHDGMRMPEPAKLSQSRLAPFQQPAAAPPIPWATKPAASRTSTGNGAPIDQPSTPGMSVAEPGVTANMPGAYPQAAPAQLKAPAAQTTPGKPDPSKLRPFTGPDKAVVDKPQVQTPQVQPQGRPQAQPQAQPQARPQARPQVKPQAAQVPKPLPAKAQTPHGTEMYRQANQLMQDVENARKANGGAPDAKLDAMGLEASNLLDQLADLMQTIEHDNKFYKVHKARCEGYRGRQPDGLEQTVDVVAAATIGKKLFAFTQNINTLAMNLAL
ncbi:hypothetical protein [Pseudaquabacterium terrae]|uniref:hypothetical protein n=1 Tax=Pseudaquabacterium terrae TaxID=2732868 RepID=UPI001C272157|nr:hypothetical protein [Aquabacterium terrae]